MLSYVGRKAFVRERILDAAFDCFARQGYEAVSTRDIAKAANVGHASMYKHFNSKEELGKEVYRVCLGPILNDIKNIRDEHDNNNECILSINSFLYQLYDAKPRALALLIFPPHEFTPWELAKKNTNSPRSILLQLVAKDTWLEAVIWGIMSGPLQDRYNKRLKGTMQEHASTVNEHLKHILKRSVKDA